MRAELINTGTELLTGQTQNANALYLASELTKLGVRVWRQTTVTDSLGPLKETIAKAVDTSELVIVTGGLGPTVDDITREATAEALGLELEMDKSSLTRIEAFFQARGSIMVEANRKQALMLTGSLALPNDVGTAPGMVIQVKGCTLVLLPGPPYELKPMFSNYLAKYLVEKKLVSSVPVPQKIIKLWGIGESAVQEELADLHQNEPGIEISYQAYRGEVWVKLTPVSGQAKAHCLEKPAREIIRRMGDRVFGFDNDTLEEVTACLLLDRKLTISLAESCTGGLIAKKLTDLPGSSEYMMYGVVSYSNEAKARILGVSGETLSRFGAVSEETAQEMAIGVKKLGNTDLAVSVTGIAGPGGGSESKPVGLVHIGLAHREGVFARRFIFYGNRENIRELTARAALNMVRLYILHN